MNSPNENMTFDENTKIGLWGPPADQVEAVATKAPRRKKPWGLSSMVWAFVSLIASQMLLLLVVLIGVLSEQTVEIDTVEALTPIIDETFDRISTGPGMVAALLSQWAVFVGVPLAASYRRGHRSLAKDFGFVFTVRDIPKGLGLAVLMQVVFLGLNWVLQQTPLDLRGADNTGMVTDNSGTLLIILLLAAAIGAPITEELFFRGLMLRAFLRTFAKRDFAAPIVGLTDHINSADVTEKRRKYGTWAAVGLSALVFGLLHTPISDGENVVTPLAQVFLVAQTGALGLLFAVIAVRSKSLSIPIWTHVFFNSISVLATLALAGT